MWVNCLKTLKKLSIYLPGMTPSAPSETSPGRVGSWGGCGYFRKWKMASGEMKRIEMASSRVLGCQRGVVDMFWVDDSQEIWQNTSAYVFSFDKVEAGDFDGVSEVPYHCSDVGDQGWYYQDISICVVIGPIVTLWFLWTFSYSFSYPSLKCIYHFVSLSLSLFPLMIYRVKQSRDSKRITLLLY